MKIKNSAKWKKIKKDFKRDWQLHLCIACPIIYLIIFDFIPMYGIQIAFRDFRPIQGITESTWVGLEWFEQFLSNHRFGTIFKNTVILSLYSMTTFPLPIIFALVLHAMKSEKYTKVVQTVSYIPHFISITVMIGIIQVILSPVSGIYGNMYRLLGGMGIPENIIVQAKFFRHIYVWSGVWQSLGWSSIIYIAALSSVSSELHEAAQIDGATRLKRMWYIDIPAILPTIAIQFILRCTNIISVGFEKAFLLQHSLNESVSEVISTYVYKEGMKSFRSYSYGAAVGLFNTVINLALLFFVNYTVRKATDGEVSLF